MLESFSEFTGIELETNMFERLKFHSKTSGIDFKAEAKTEDFSSESCREAYHQLMNFLI